MINPSPIAPLTLDRLQLIKAAISIINENLGQNGWRGGEYAGITQAIGQLTAAELSRLMADERTNPDFLPYLWTFHVTWGFESAWAEMVRNPPEIPDNDFEADGVPENFNPNVPLAQVPLLAPQGHTLRVVR